MSVLLWSVVGIGSAILIALVVVIVIMMTDTKIIIDNNSSKSSCCAQVYKDSDGTKYSACEYQPYKHNAGGDVDSTLKNAYSFAESCAFAGGTTTITDSGGVECSCECIGPSRDLDALVAPSGQYYESVAVESSGNASIVSTCPGYRN